MTYLVGMPFKSDHLNFGVLSFICIQIHLQLSFKKLLAVWVQTYIKNIYKLNCLNLLGQWYRAEKKPRL